MAFFDPQEAFLAGDNGFFSARKGALRIKPAGVFLMSCVDGFYAEARKNIFLAKKVVKQFFTYFSMTRGGVSSYATRIKNLAKRHYAEGPYAKAEPFYREALTIIEKSHGSRMIAIAFSHQGTLDRIVGDSVAIMFSAPMLQVDHQRRAINCALDMHRFASQYCRDLNAKGIAFGQTRIGIHTGEVIVGNFGGSTIFDYRALGDPVNTASRLEGANKHLGTLVCVSEATLSGCPNMPARSIGRLLLKGKSIPLMVFEVFDNQAAKHIEIKDYLTAYELMRESQTSALEVFRQLSGKYPDDGLVAFHLKRLRTGKTGDLIELSEK